MLLPDDFFEKNTRINMDVMRNIVSLRESVSLFDELSDDPDDQAVAIQSELEIKKELQDAVPSVIYKGFWYNKAIAYPFLTEPFLNTRFGTGAYGVWYGSLELKTTIYETCYHLFRAILSSENYPNIVKQERAVFAVHCDSILIDLSGKVEPFPDLISNDYSFCHFVGNRLQKDGHPGILYASARTAGKNVAIFNPNVLSYPRNSCYLTYIFSASEKKIRIERDVAKEWFTIDTRKEFGL